MATDPIETLVEKYNDELLRKLKTELCSCEADTIVPGTICGNYWTIRESFRSAIREAIEGERERCANASCRLCARGTEPIHLWKADAAELIDGKWMHKSTEMVTGAENYVPCNASAIRSLRS